jgi:hypothetical protein
MQSESNVRLFTTSMLVMTILIISYFFLQFSDILTFLAFIILVPVFVRFKYNGKVPVAFAVVMFILSAITLSISANPTTTGINAANVFAIYAFWLLVVGIICLALEYRRERRINGQQ